MNMPMMSSRLNEAIESLIDDCKVNITEDQTRDQLAECCGLQRASCLVELRNAFREALSWTNP